MGVHNDFTQYFGEILTSLESSRVSLKCINPSDGGDRRNTVPNNSKCSNPACDAGSHSSLTRSVLKDRIKIYGFIQCGQIYSFLDYVCDTCPGEAELKYVQGKLVECLVEHDGSVYFSGLKTLLQEVNYALVCCSTGKGFSPLSQSLGI